MPINPGSKLPEGERPPNYTSICEACGYDTSIDQTAVRTILNTKAEFSQLSVLCLKCFACGLVWSAKQALPVARP